MPPGMMQKASQTAGLTDGRLESPLPGGKGEGARAAAPGCGIRRTLAR
jgi:hypothetical protein